MDYNLNNININIFNYLTSDEIKSLLIDKNNEPRITLDLDHIQKFDQTLGKAILNNPLTIIPLMEKCLNENIQNNKQVNNPKNIDLIKNRKKEQIYLSFKNILKTHLVTPRGLTSRLINKYVGVQGIVSRISQIKVKSVYNTYYCEDSKMGIKKDNNKQMKISELDDIYQSLNINGKEDNNINHDHLILEFGLSKFKDYQTFVLQDPHEIIPKRQLPKTIKVILEGDLVDKVKIGERIQVNGIFKNISTKEPNSFDNMKTALIATNVDKLISNDMQYELTKEDIKKIKKLSKDENLFNILVNSIAPEISGYNDIKKSLILQLLGGNNINSKNINNMKEVINILIIGGRTSVKSEFLKYIEKNFPNSINIKSKNNSVKDLFPSVLFDKYSNKRIINPGKIILLENGIVCINELEKINDLEKNIIKEVLDNQAITFCKTDMYEKFNTRCSILATANPKFGEYILDISPSINTGFSDSFLSLFDFCFKIINNHNKKLIGENHMNTNSISNLNNENKNNRLSIDFLRKYIYYAKSNINPQLTKEAEIFISKAYAKLRDYKIEIKNEFKTEVIPITVRSLKSLIKIATAFAKSRLSQKIEKIDCINTLELFCNMVFNENDEFYDNSIGEGKEKGTKRKKKKKNKSEIKEEKTIKDNSEIITLKEEDEYREDNKEILKVNEYKQSKEENKIKKVKDDDNNDIINDNKSEIKEEKTIKENSEIITLKEEDEYREDNKEILKVNEYKQSKEKNTIKKVKDDDNNDKINDNLDEITKEQINVVYKHIFDFTKRKRHQTISIDELWKMIKDKKECINNNILSKSKLLNICSKLDDEGKTFTSITLV